MLFPLPDDLFTFFFTRLTPTTLEVLLECPLLWEVSLDPLLGQTPLLWSPIAVHFLCLHVYPPYSTVGFIVSLSYRGEAPQKQGPCRPCLLFPRTCDREGLYCFTLYSREAGTALGPVWQKVHTYFISNLTFLLPGLVTENWKTWLDR